MHWHILGAGAIGLLWAGKLLTAGHRVTLILRNQAKLELYRQQGSFTIAADGTNTRFTTTAELADNPSVICNLLITTKSFSAVEAFNSVKKRLSGDAQVLLLHNGLGPQQQLAQENPSLKIWAGSTTDGAYLKAPLQLVRAGIGKTEIGCLTDPDQQLLFQQLESCDTNLSYATNIENVLWRKLAINCAINPLTGIYNCRNGELLKYDDRRAAMAQICKEVEQVAAALNIKLFDRKLMEQAWDVAELTGNNHSSMQQDMLHGRPTEIETITGYLCHKAADAGITTPANQMVLDAIRSMSKG